MFLFSVIFRLRLGGTLKLKYQSNNNISSSLLAFLALLLLIIQIAGYFFRIDELGDHVVGNLGLVSRHHMSSLVHSHKGEVFEIPDRTTSSEKRGRLPLVKLLLDEFLLAIPNESLGPIIASLPVADVVLVAIVDQNG